MVLTAADNVKFQRACKNLIAEYDRIFRKSLSLFDTIMWDLRVFVFKIRFRKEIASMDENKMYFPDGSLFDAIS